MDLPPPGQGVEPGGHRLAQPLGDPVEVVVAGEDGGEPVPPAAVHDPEVLDLHPLAGLFLGTSSKMQTSAVESLCTFRSRSWPPSANWATIMDP